MGRSKDPVFRVLLRKKGLLLITGMPKSRDRVFPVIHPRLPLFTIMYAAFGAQKNFLLYPFVRVGMVSREGHNV